MVKYDLTLKEVASTKNVQYPNEHLNLQHSGKNNKTKKLKQPIHSQIKK